jgi:hypothetical protein
MDELTLELAQLARNECEKIVEKISQIKQIDKNELQDHYLPTQIYFNEIVNNTILKKKKKTNKRNLPKNEQCLGRKGDFTQCTRKRKDGTFFCGSHMKKLTNGMIGDDGACFNRKKGKRGRKRKNIMENVGENDILTTKKYIDGERYLVDNRNVVYTYNQESPVILGYLSDGRICDFE